MAMLNKQRVITIYIYIYLFKYTDFWIYEVVFHTTSGASRSGPPSTYLNVVTVYSYGSYAMDDPLFIFTHLVI